MFAYLAMGKKLANVYISFETFYSERFIKVSFTLRSDVLYQENIPCLSNGNLAKHFISSGDGG